MTGLIKPKNSSKYTDIEVSYKKVKNRRWRWNRILQMLKEPQVVAHIASVVTILVTFFGTEPGDNQIFNIIIVIFGIVWIATGIYSMKALFNKETKAVVNYSELHDLLTVARFEAQKSIINIGGDLSWLKKDIGTLREIKDEHPDVQIKIYYDKGKLSQETKKLIADLRAENSIQLLPYPMDFQTPSIRCMVTDFEDAEIENCKIYLYPKVEGENAAQHLKDKFAWQEYTYKTNPNLFDSVTSLLNALESVCHHQVIVGITGINNTGKTSIVNKCKEKLPANFSVRIVPDAFSMVTGNEEFSYVNRQIIFQQVIDLHQKYTEDIIIFDRTPFDNFIYLVMREMMSETDKRQKRRKNALFIEYAKLIQELMKNFDLIYGVKRKKESNDCKTKWITPKERKVLLKLYNEFSGKFLSRDVQHFEVSGEAFEKDVEEAALELVNYIQEYYYTGSSKME